MLHSWMPCVTVIKAWNDTNAETVIQSFKKCDMLNSMDSTMTNTCRKMKMKRMPKS